MIARIVLAIALCVPIITTGCASSSTQATAPRPGAINAFDSNAFDTLFTIQAAIEKAKTEFANTPEAQAPLLKVRTAYNLAMNLYKAYHAAGVSDPAKESDLQQKISAASAALTAFRATFKEKP